MTELLAIIPRLSPLVDGIGDYALSLARLLRDEAGIHTRFLVTDPAWAAAHREAAGETTASGEPTVEGFVVSSLPERTTAALLAALRAAEARAPKVDASDGVDSASGLAVLLHYEGYGYALRGCPVWLVRALTAWRKADGGRQLLTMFHELYAQGPPWTSSFWLSPLQKSLTTRLAGLSGQWITSLSRYAETLGRLCPQAAARAYSLPVFSSIGEPSPRQAARRLGERQRRLMVFGTRGRRIEVYQRAAADLNRLCERLGVTEILDVGRAVEFDFAGQLRVPVREFGELPGAAVSELLLDAVAGVIDYPAAVLGKSTIFAAYCAHRVIPVLVNHGLNVADSTPADGLEGGRQYWLAGEAVEALDEARGQAIADAAFAWYQAHNLATHARRFAAALHTEDAAALCP